VISPVSSRASSVVIFHIHSSVVSDILCVVLAGSSGDQIEKNDMGGACSTYGGKQKCIQGFGWET